MNSNTKNSKPGKNSQHGTQQGGNPQQVGQERTEQVGFAALKHACLCNKRDCQAPMCQAIRKVYVYLVCIVLIAAIDVVKKIKKVDASIL